VTPAATVISQHRWHIVDAIPFEERLRFDMEIWSQAVGTLDVNATAYWYAVPGSRSDAAVPRLAKREVWKR